MKDRRTFRALLTSLTLGTAALGLSSGAQADPRHPEFPINIAGAQTRAEAHFAEVDSNGDGILSRAEFEAADWPHPPSEHGGMGHHPGIPGTPPSVAPGMPPLGRADPSAREEKDRALFSSLDANGDGMLSPEEFSARKLPEHRDGFRRERIFDHLDANSDGQLTRDELPDMVARLRAMDADGDGMVTREEAVAYRRSQKRAEG